MLDIDNIDLFVGSLSLEDLEDNDEEKKKKVKEDEPDAKDSD